MRSKTLPRFIFVGMVLVAFLLFLAWYVSKPAAHPLQQARKSYEEAVKASNIIQRNIYLNQALSTYISLENQYHPIRGNGKLYHNMGEIFFDLQQYPWAALYFYQARALMPRNEAIEQKLQKTLKELNLVSHVQDSIFKRVFFFHYYLSLPERLQILGAATLLLFVLVSLYIWKYYSFLKSVIAAVILLWGLFFSSVIYTKYFEPLEGALIQASMLYRGANSSSALVTPKPIMEGDKVEVLDVLDEGKWLKIRTSDEKLGFIEASTIRLIKI